MQVELLSVKEVSQLTGLHEHTVRKRVKEGTFKALPRTTKNDKMLIFKESITNGKAGESKNL